MQLISVNVGIARPIAAKSGSSGIFKQSTQDSVRVTTFGLQDDQIVDHQNHGGVDQAVYIYTVEDYAWWEGALGRQLAPGIFGENLTVAGAESASWAVGDIFMIGAPDSDERATLQVTSPRVPCVTLATRMGDPKFVKRFTQAGRPGVYCRVLAEGSVRAGDPVEYMHDKHERINVMEMFRFELARDKSPDELRRYLRAPIAIRARDYYESLLAVREGEGG
jgi:MOSC domain-containing protein YiiM